MHSEGSYLAGGGIDFFASVLRFSRSAAAAAAAALAFSWASLFLRSRSCSSRCNLSDSSCSARSNSSCSSRMRSSSAASASACSAAAERAAALAAELLGAESLSSPATWNTMNQVEIIGHGTTPPHLQVGCWNHSFLPLCILALPPVVTIPLQNKKTLVLCRREFIIPIRSEVIQNNCVFFLCFDVSGMLRDVLIF